jgi:mannose-6-phosphate isomerase-like protein (cupin superfamily)
MIITDLAKTKGRRYPAHRLTQNIVGGSSPIQATNFSIGNVTLDANGGQVPWHNQLQEEVYFIIEGTAEMCLGDSRQTLTTGQAVYIPSEVFHQITNIGPTPLRMIYCYGPAGDVAHWHQELEGTLPKAGIDAPPLPKGARAQITDKPLEAV